MGRRTRTRLGALGLALVGALGSATGGCALLAGIDDWEDPPARGATSSSGGGGSAGGGGSLQENATCADGEKNGLETDVDCGGDSCWPCALGEACANDGDCSSLRCAAGVCVEAPDPLPCAPLDPQNPSCGDCTQNALETDIDCGGDACPPCAQGLACDFDNDCESASCVAGQCGAPVSPGCAPVDVDNPSCDDCTQNGLETDVDCGGDACPPCAVGLGCASAVDCVSGQCAGGQCAPAQPPGCSPVDPDNPTCADCVKNGLETDVDCGGDSCSPCPSGDQCSADADCVSGTCPLGVCQ